MTVTWRSAVQGKTSTLLANSDDLVLVVARALSPENEFGWGFVVLRDPEGRLVGVKGNGSIFFSAVRQVEWVHPPDPAADLGQMFDTTEEAQKAALAWALEDLRGRETKP